MMTKGNDTLKKLYEKHDTVGIVDFLARHKTDPQYSNLYARAIGPNRDLYGAVEKYLSDNLQNRKNEEKSLYKIGKRTREKEATLEGLEEKIIKEVQNMGNEELLRAYQEVVEGTSYYLGSLKGGPNNIINLQKYDIKEQIALMAHARKSGTYEFARKVYSQDKNKKLKINMQGGTKKETPVIEILLKTYKDLVIIEEAVERLIKESVTI